MGTDNEHQETITRLKEQIRELKATHNLIHENVDENIELYRSFFSDAPFGASLNKIVYNETGKPVDFIIKQINKEFEKAIGAPGKEVINKPVKKRFSELEKKWINKFNNVVTSGKKREYTEFTLDGKNFYNIHVYSPQKEYFILTLVKKLKKYKSTLGPIRFYERLMDHLHEGIWVTDKNDIIFFVNQGITYNTGDQKQDLLGKNIFHFNPKNVGNFLDKYRCAKEKLMPAQYESQLVTLNGQDAVLAGWLVPLIKKGRFDGMICTIRNISEEKRNRQIIRENEEKLRNIIEHSTNVFYSHTTDHILTYVSPQMETLLGYTPEETQTKWTNLTSDDPINQIGFNLTNRAIETGEIQRPYELELVHKNGSLVWVEVREAPVLENGKTTSIVGALSDITEQKQIARQLMENQRGLRNLVDESPVPILIRSMEGDIEYLNHEFTKAFGYTVEDIPHVDTWFKLAYPDETYRNQMINKWSQEIENRSKSNESETPFEAKVSCKDESVKFVQIVWSYIGDKLVLILNNLTKYKALEQEILQKNDELQNALNELRKTNMELQKASEKAKESDQLKSAFLANMSHEIRTPMNSIIGFSSLLAQPNVSAEKQKRYTDFIQNAGNHLLRIIDDIIDVAKIESNQLKIEKSYFSIVPFLESTYEYHLQSKLFRSTPNVELRLKHDAIKKAIIIFTDPTRLKQVFDNLLTNSIKNTQTGHIELGVREVEENSITFYVTDTGSGIPKNFKKTIFKRFTQVQSKSIKPGTGLGLSIIKGIINLLDGEIWFESEELVGTSFYFKLPIQPEEN